MLPLIYVVDNGGNHSDRRIYFVLVNTQDIQRMDVLITAMQKAWPYGRTRDRPADRRGHPALLGKVQPIEWAAATCSLQEFADDLLTTLLCGLEDECADLQAATECARMAKQIANIEEEAYPTFEFSLART